jgi:hypothetical protein
VRGSRVLASSDPPSRFADERVGQFVRDQVTAGTIPGPDADNQTLYGVVMPTGVSLDRGFWEGQHNYHGRPVNGCITRGSRTQDPGANHRDHVTRDRRASDRS